MDELFFIYNGRYFPEGANIVSAGHPALQYGDGIFESGRIARGVLLNAALHFERMKHGCKLLNLDLNETIKKEISEGIRSLSIKHSGNEHLRIRISLLRSHGSFNPALSPIDLIIESSSLAPPSFSSDGIHTLIYTESTKGTGLLANLKSNNFLLHAHARRLAIGMEKDDAIILNGHGRVCETTIANIFFAEGDQLFTPPLSEGCVAGTIRQWVLNHAAENKLSIKEETCTPQRIMKADEVFVTNAIRWVVPVRRINQTEFKVNWASKVFNLLQKNLMPESRDS